MDAFAHEARTPVALVNDAVPTMGAVCLRAFSVCRSQGINLSRARTSPHPVMGGSWKVSPESLPRGPFLNGAPQAPGAELSPLPPVAIY